METSHHYRIHYRIHPDRFAQVRDAIRADGCSDATDEQVLTVLLADYPEGQEHQEFLDAAPVEEIANWAWHSVRAAIDEALFDAEPVTA